jgi:AcrR family transcriptional regulator
MTAVSTAHASPAYEQTGRSAQKQRTRAALVAAARDLVATGVTPTVEEAAVAAGISRTTAYRYVANRRELLVAAHPETGARTLLPADPPTDPAARLDAVVVAFLELITATEAQQRTMLRLSLEADDEARAALPLRQGRAVEWFAEALQPLADLLTAAELQALARAVRSAVGIEALVWLVDVAGLSRAEAIASMRWAAAALLRSAMAGHLPPTPGG